MGSTLPFLFQEKVRAIVRTENPDAWGRLGSSPFLPARSLSARTAGTGGKGAGNGGSRATMSEGAWQSLTLFPSGGHDAQGEDHGRENPDYGGVTQGGHVVAKYHGGPQALVHVIQRQ